MKPSLRVAVPRAYLQPDVEIHSRGMAMLGLRFPSKRRNEGHWYESRIEIVTESRHDGVAQSSLNPVLSLSR